MISERLQMTVLSLNKTGAVKNQSQIREGVHGVLSLSAGFWTTDGFLGWTVTAFSSVPHSESIKLSSIISNRYLCGWTSLKSVGHKTKLKDVNSGDGHVECRQWWQGTKREEEKSTKICTMYMYETAKEEFNGYVSKRKNFQQESDTWFIVSKDNMSLAPLMLWQGWTCKRQI